MKFLVLCAALFAAPVKPAEVPGFRWEVNVFDENMKLVAVWHTDNVREFMVRDWTCRFKALQALGTTNGKEMLRKQDGLLTCKKGPIVVLTKVAACIQASGNKAFQDFLQEHTMGNSVLILVNSSGSGRLAISTECSWGKDA